jgi:hypothetical protein
MVEAISSQCLPIFERALIFGGFPGFARFSPCEKQQHVDK